jgi:aerobic carbon-monoxide dehydrogenase medium subunit
MTAVEEVTARATEVLMPASEEDAVAAFGDGVGVTVIGGGTIVVPEMTYRRLTPEKVILLGGAGLAGISREGSTVTIGAGTSVHDLIEMSAPLGPCAANIADLEIRSQATVGGNLCAEGSQTPRGDLQSALLALGATARSAGEGGIAAEPLEAFLARRRERLLLDVTFEEPPAGAFASLDRPHTHDFTALAVSGVRTAEGEIRLAATGVGSWGRRLPSAEAAAADPGAAGRAALGDVELVDDALASAWYRERTLPVLVRRVLTELEEAA